MINQIIANIRSFGLVWWFQVLCFVAANSVYSFFHISAKNEVWYSDDRRRCCPRDVSKTWSNLMEEIGDHVYAAVTCIQERPVLISAQIMAIRLEVFRDY
jgi:hypothetical protein